MRLLLIRHGETVDNVAGMYAGHTDSALTNHGVLQAKRLGTHLDLQKYKVSSIFCSDLQRASQTADAISDSQSHQVPPKNIIKLEVLREKNFGSYEARSYNERPKGPKKTGREAQCDSRPGLVGTDFKEEESRDSMRCRMDRFINEYLHNILNVTPDDSTVAVVAHGIINLYLWRSLLARFLPGHISVASSVGMVNGPGLEYLGAWSNTGYWDLEIKHLESPTLARISDQNTEPEVDSSNATIPPTCSADGKSPARCLSGARPSTLLEPSRKFLNMSLLVKAVNSKEHLVGFRKAGGGLGNVKHDSSQRTMESYFQKKRKIAGGVVNTNRQSTMFNDPN